MARTMQYRVWDKEVKRFLPEAFTNVIVPGVGMLSERDDSDFIYQEYTGLGDSNGKPIFEGDILTGKEGGLVLGYVSFEGGCFGIQIEYDSHFMPFSEVLYHETVVVGNIFEHGAMVVGYPGITKP